MLSSSQRLYKREIKSSLKDIYTSTETRDQKFFFIKKESFEQKWVLLVHEF